MKIIHNSDMVKKFSDIMLTKFYQKSTVERTGFHRSDAISCPLKAYWRITGEIGQEYGTRDVGMLLLGTLAHIAMHEYFDAHEQVFKLHEIAITVDAIFGEHPIETKTTRKKIYKKEDLPQSWIAQLAIAMAVMKVNKGYLMVLNIITYGLTVWEITMPTEERDLFKQSCIWQILSISDAIESKDPSKLSPKHSDCQWCSYRPTRKRPKGCSYYKKPPKKTK